MTKEERKEVMANLKVAAANVSEDAVQVFLNTTAKKYSFTNVQMILAQAPFASAVAGFNDWKKAGRVVRKGEKGIAIYAPNQKRDEVTDEITDTFFRVVYVFDVSQTEELVKA